MDTHKILVTGGAGYIGSQLVDRLLARGYLVRVLDNLTYGDAGIRELLGRDNLEFIDGDVRKVQDVVKAVQGISTVISLAAIVGDSACELDQEATLSTNFEATKILVNVCNLNNVRRLIFASSCSVYGVNSEDILNEASQMNPVSLYARTRRMSEEFILNDSDKVVPVILRLGTVFGLSRRMRFDVVVNIMTAKALIDRKIIVLGGNQWRPNIHVKDAADAFIMAAEASSEQVDGNIFNVGGNALNYRILEIGRIVKDCIPAAKLEIKYNMNDKRSYRIDFSKIEQVLGFRTRFDLKDGIREIVGAISDGTLANYEDEIYHNMQYLSHNHAI